MKKLISLILIFCAFKVAAQTYTLNYDSVRVGKTPNSSILIPKDIYMKGLPKGLISIRADGRVIHNDTAYATQSGLSIYKLKSDSTASTGYQTVGNFFPKGDTRYPTISGNNNLTGINTAVTPLTTDRSKKIATMEAVYNLSKSIADSSANYNTTQLYTATPTSGTTVTVATNATILSVTRSGSSYYYANNTSPTGNNFYYDGSVGTVKFQDAFNSTGEDIAVQYRGSRTIAGTVYYGPSAAIPTTVGDLSSLTSAALATTFISNTGTTYRYFNLVMNQAYTISNVTDLDAGAFGNITANYIFRGTIVISSITYNVYTMINGIPFSTNHRHQFTIN